jgi:iron complex outermembrane receptor protein
MTCRARNTFLIAPLALALMPVMPVQTAAAAKLEEVVVTARKREESLQRTPVSITALTADTIEAAKLFNIKDIEQLTPNLNFVVGADGSGSSLQAFIRGIGQFDFAVTTDPGVGVYIDGVYLARTVGANIEFSDIERISVLRGPQGTLFGKNTIGGAINVVTRAPSGETSYSAEVTAGEYGYKGVDGYVEFPISDTVAGSLSVLWKESDGWQKRDRGDDAGNDDMYGLRGHLNWDVSETWNSHLVVDTVQQDQNVYPRVLSDFDPLQFFPFLYNSFVLGLPPGESCCEPNIDDIDRSHVLNERDRDELDTLGVSWTNTWDLNGMTLKSITGYREMEAEMFRDSDNSVNPYFSVETIFDTDQFSQEFLLSDNDGGALDWLVGLYYFVEEADHYTGVTVAEGLYEVLSSLPPEVTTPDGVPFSFLAVPLDLTLDYERSQETTSYAAFFSTTWHMSERARLNVAARYTYDEKELDTFTLKRASQTPIALPGPTAPAECSDVVASGNGSVFSCKEDWSEFSPKIGIDYDIGENLMGYADISRGFRSGVFNGRPISTEEISVADPETVTAYEVGFKSQLLDQTLQINGAVFYNDYEDQQFLVNQSSADTAAGLVLLVDNAGESTLTGAELEVTWLATESLTIAGSAAWLDPEYDKWEQVDFITGETQDLSNRPFRDVPEWTASLYAQYDWQLAGGGNLRLRGDLSYRDDIYYTNDDTSPSFERLHADSFTLYNAGVTYTSPSGAWEFGVYGRNLGDEREIIGGFDVAAFGSTDVAFTEPRRYFASIKYTGGSR